MKTTGLIALVLAVALLVSGCAPYALTAVNPAEEVALPARVQELPAAPQGDSRADRNIRVTLYAVGNDQQQLVSVSRMLRLSGEDTLIERVAGRLLSGSSGLLAAAPEGTKLSGYELSQGILTLDLSVDALMADAQALCFLRAALTNTMTSLPGIRYLNMLVDGREESALTLPSGAMSMTDGNLTALWAQRQADEERFLTDPVSAQIERTMTLYFASWTDNRLLPEARPVTLTSDNFALRALNELRRGPAASLAHGVLPAEAKLRRAPETVTLPDGRRVLRLSFREDLYDLLEKEGLSALQLYAAMTLTLCRFVPELNGLMVGVGGKLVTSVGDGARARAFADGVMTPNDFDGLVGRVAKLYFAGDDGRLKAVERVMDLESAVSPRALIDQIIAGPLVFDEGARSVVPEGVTDADILGIRVQDNVLLINLSSNFYRLCQGLDETAERNLVYALVNTLCELDGVNRVRFYVAGKSVELLGRSICLLSELLPNPGLGR